MLQEKLFSEEINKKVMMNEKMCCQMKIRMTGKNPSHIIVLKKKVTPNKSKEQFKSAENVLKGLKQLNQKRRSSTPFKFKKKFLLRLLWFNKKI